MVYSYTSIHINEDDTWKVMVSDPDEDHNLVMVMTREINIVSSDVKSIENLIKALSEAVVHLS